MIQGLTTGQRPRATRLGVLRKGAPKPPTGNRPGRDLDRFRFDPKNSDDTRLVAAFEAAHPTGNNIAVYLPYPTAAENFEAWQEEWTASQLRHRCDGVHLYERDTYGVLYNTRRPCPGGCKRVGRLTIILPALIESAHRFGFVALVTTSLHDIVELDQTLRYYETLASGDLRGIPFVLSRQVRRVSVPLNGKRVSANKSLVFIEPAPQWVKRQMEIARTQHLVVPPSVVPRSASVLLPSRHDAKPLASRSSEHCEQCGEPIADGVKDGRAVPAATIAALTRHHSGKARCRQCYHQWRDPKKRNEAGNS